MHLIYPSSRLFGKRHDYRRRRNRRQILIDAFKPQMEAAADAYVEWDLRQSADGLGTLVDAPADRMVQGLLPMWVVDLFSESPLLPFLCSIFLPLTMTYIDARLVNIPLLAGDVNVTAGFVNLGYFPCSPSNATVLITTRVLELYRIAALRCPRLAIQPWVKSLCDLHGVAFRPYLSVQFSIAFDLYLATRAIVNARVKAVLHRDAPNWRLKNACPACMYKLEGEPPLLLPFLSTKDGNNSLKRWGRREHTEDGSAGASTERMDDRTVAGDYYLTRDAVNVWAKEGLEDLLKGFVPGDSDAVSLVFRPSAVD
jgi:hypothetical protein